jgi:DNA-binding PadR family transcriptional regulator
VATLAGVRDEDSGLASSLLSTGQQVGGATGLAVLSLLSREPMHPYELGRSLREHGDDRSIKFNHGSLYMVVGQLARAGFITEQETSRGGQRPERTVYALTDAGRDELRDWLRDLVAQPQHEYPAFVSALSADRGAAAQRGTRPAAHPARPPRAPARRDPRTDREIAVRGSAGAVPD